MESAFETAVALRSKIESIMKDNNRSIGSTLDRNILIVQTYFGMGSLNAPTHEETGILFGNISRQRVQQIIADKFTQHIKGKDIQVIKDIASVILENPFHNINILSEKMISKGLILGEIGIKGLLNLLHEFNLCTNYEIYTTTLAKATLNELRTDEGLFLIKIEERDRIKEALKVFRTAPGQTGLCNFDEIFHNGDYSEALYEPIKSLIITDINSYVYQDEENSFWYIFEDRSNVIFNSLAKLKTIEENIDINTLSKLILQNLSSRSFDHEIPESEIIESYLRRSRYVEVDENYVNIKLDSKPLNAIEKDIVDYYDGLTEKTSIYTELFKHLKNKGYSKPNIDKNIYHSLFLNINKNDGIGEYKYSIYTSNAVVKLREFSDEYAEFKKQLEALSGMTDLTAEGRYRREQRLLRDWLFGNKDFEVCAICNRRFNVNSLITAHKKKRSLCTEIERTDPNIVMPLCLFGCDYLYESEYASIEDGKVTVTYCDQLYESEIEYLKGIEGNLVNPKWILGSEDYFRREK